MQLSQSVLASTLLSLSALSVGINALPNVPPRDSTNRYLPGPVSAVSQALDTEGDGYISLGADGVLRSFAGNGTVLDYHQLDPDQVSSFAASQLAAWKASGLDMPSSVVDLAGASAVDGRLVTNLDQLLEPTERPAGTSTVKEREVLDMLSNAEKRQSCVGAWCQSITECVVAGCAACYFPGGPPWGVCFFS